MRINTNIKMTSYQVEMAGLDFKHQLETEKYAIAAEVAGEYGVAPADIRSLKKYLEKS
ncbi:hypothetical protein [Bacillus sp. FJAT-50079]|uniref:hypothetical protein n=1 Tax=Bacillus sp. FJAT-50079 TaxID=2833577 RepID=UPI001BC95691|nr:hypothetical protein [Bacillus sp. FJAT-50079]MBS4208995.1 hypothetical protein [Bacillus sp. FJAT-50079]